MSTRVLRVKGASVEELRHGVAVIQQELGVTPEFAPEVEQVAAEAADPTRARVRRDAT